MTSTIPEHDLWGPACLRPLREILVYSPLAAFR
jgi:hypothetical protein